MKLILPQNTIFSRAEASLPDPVLPAAGGFAFTLPKQPPIADFGLLACKCPSQEDKTSKI